MDKHKLKCIALGCSHTRLKALVPGHRWFNLVYDKTGASFVNQGRTASGFVQMVARLLRNIESLADMDYVVIQKPQSIRYPWWDTHKYNNEDLKNSLGSYANSRQDMVKGRKTSMLKYGQLNQSEAKKIADFIEKKERGLLKTIRKTLPNAKMAYYHYWGDYIIDSIQRPLLAENNVKLGEFAEEIGIENWKTIIDPSEIPGVYDSDGDILFDKIRMFKSGWICSETDPHPSLKFQEKVAERVEKWFG